MTCVNQSVWTCDRCGVEKVTMRGDQPSAWHRMETTRPPKSEMHSGRKHLCDACGTKLVGFMNPMPVSADGVQP
jgi:hypothetical protein